MNKFLFPEIKTTRSTTEQAQKIVDEVNEYLEANSDEEAIDVLHAVETFIRIHFKGREEILDRLIQSTIEKNSKRGYYQTTCY